MITGNVAAFFDKSARRTHSQTAKMMLQTDDWLHTWIRRYKEQVTGKTAKAERKRAKAKTRVKRLYGHDAVVIFRFGYALHLHGWPPKDAVDVAASIYSKFRRAVIDPALAAGADNDTIRRDIDDTFAVIRTLHPDQPANILILRTAELADAYAFFVSEPVVTNFCCGKQLLTLIDIAAQQDQEAAAAAETKSSTNQRKAS